MSMVCRSIQHSRGICFIAIYLLVAPWVSAEGAAVPGSGATSPGSSTAPSLPPPDGRPPAPGSGYAPPAAAPSTPSYGAPGAAPAPPGYAVPSASPPASGPPPSLPPYPGPAQPYPGGYAPPAYAPGPSGYADPRAIPPGAPNGNPGASAGVGTAVLEVPLPHKAPELSFSIRYNVIDLLFGKVSGEIEYVFAGPFSVVVAPEYIFADTRQDRQLGITASGAGIYGELGWWVEGHPLRGYFLKAHVAHRSVTFRSDVDELAVPQTLIGAMFGSQSIYGGWFTVSGGFGLAYDTQAADRTLQFHDPATPTVLQSYTLTATGPFQNGIDLITQLSLGASF